MALITVFRGSCLKPTNVKHCNLPICLQQKRFRFKKKWAMNLPTKTPCDLALDHFDAFYKPLYGDKWPSIRASLLSQNKYAAIINNASDAEEWSQRLNRQGANDLIRDAAKKLKSSLQKTAENSLLLNKQTELSAPSHVRQRAGDGETFVLSDYDNQVDSDSSNTTKKSSIQQEVNGGQSDAIASWDVRDQRTDATDNGDTLYQDTRNYSSTDLQHFMPTEQVLTEREELRQAELRQSTFQDRPVSVTVLPAQAPSLPLPLRVVAYPPGNVADFPTPKADSAGNLNYYLLDAASILPVLALDLRPNDTVLDLCAAPGGKTLAMLQIITAQGGHLTSNDVSSARLWRMKQVFRSYFPQDILSEFSRITDRRGETMQEPLYKKVLVDAPCNSDRHVLKEEDNNLFKPGRVNDRLMMTSRQKQLLIGGIRSCRPGGTVVYSTCTLAAVQNDGVVQQACEELWETSNIDVAVEDISPLCQLFSPVFRFHPATRLGQLVLPSLTSNFGPMYICKLRRLQ